MSDNSFGAKGQLVVGDQSYEVFRLGEMGSHLPFSLKVLLENLLRNEDGVSVTAEDIGALAAWDGGAGEAHEIAFAPARILMQDLTGVPGVVDLAAMRDAIGTIGGDPARVTPLIPAELVVDHSVVADVYGTADAFARNAELEFERNTERYRFLRWGQGAFPQLKVVPPDTGICHQVNLEYLARVVFASEAGQAYPDTLVGIDSHTPMVNGLGVVGWGVGGIEAEAAMLGQPISMLVPPVVGFRLIGQLPEGATATDLVLTVAEVLRAHGVVGKFVEFYGPGASGIPVANRATLGNMSPEYGSTITIFPIDDQTLRYLRLTGRPHHQVALVEAYAKEQGMWLDPDATPTFSETVELDLSTVVPSLAGPSRPQDRVPLDQSKAMFAKAVMTSMPAPKAGTVDESSDESFPASDAPAPGGVSDEPRAVLSASPSVDRRRARVPVTLADGSRFELDHGHVVIAAITSCTNTSNPSVMLAAALLARNAVNRGLSSRPWVKTTLAPGSKVVMDYYDRTGLTPYMDTLGFNLVGYGCTTCIGNSGPLAPEISAAVNDHGLAVAAVLSGNRNFEGRINADVRMSYLASPPLVVAYALAGTMDIDMYTEPLGHDPAGHPVFLRDVWPSDDEVEQAIQAGVESAMFRASYADVFGGDERWRSLDVPMGDHFAWDAVSTYVRKPPFFDGLTAEPAPLTDIAGARVLALLGDSVTTDHISPAGTIRADSPAGRWLIEHGVAKEGFNSYGARRGNHEIMIRGTFANPRLRNRLAPETEGGFTVHLPEGTPSTIYGAAMQYAAEGVPLVIVAGKEYGTGSSRDWAAKGTALLGVRAVIAESFERIHRSNLLGMGVLPLQFVAGESAAMLGLSGHESISISGLTGAELPAEVTVHADELSFRAKVRIDTPKEADYYRHGGILPYVLRQLAGV